MPIPRSLREAGSKTREQYGYRFDGIALAPADPRPFYDQES